MGSISKIAPCRLGFEDGAPYQSDCLAHLSNKVADCFGESISTYCFEMKYHLAICKHSCPQRHPCLMIQCARAAGLAHVLENLMGFDGDEFYLKEWPELLGLPFGEIAHRFDDAVPIGIKHDDVLHLYPPTLHHEPLHLPYFWNSQSLLSANRDVMKSSIWIVCVPQMRCSQTMHSQYKQMKIRLVDTSPILERECE